MNVIAKSIDCFTPLTPALCKAIKDSGFKGVNRYLGRKTHNLPNGMTPDEVKLIHSFGLFINPTWEVGQTDMFRGHSGGVLDAAQAVDEMQWLGMNEPGVAIYFANDNDSPASAYTTINQYMDGVRKSLGSHYIDGLYAGYNVLVNVKATKKWQAVGWSYGHVYQQANMHQVQENVDFHGIKIDINEIYSNPGWWPVMADSKTPKDVAGTQWEDVATWATENGVMFTYGDGTFRPDEPISRGQAAASLKNLFNLLQQKKG